MRNTSILIPIILISCLTALGFLFYKALQTVEQDKLRGNNPIVLNEADYADEPTPTDIGTTTDYDAAAQSEIPTKPTNTAPTNAIDEMTEAEKRAAELEELQEAARKAREAEAAAAAETDDDEIDTTTPNAVGEPNGTGRYLVIAGSFRKRAGAEQRVSRLKSAGFRESTVEKFNRGTYAVALAGQFNRFSEARQLADRIVKAGFEAQVMRRR